jgi:hypothetical protein
MIALLRRHLATNTRRMSLGVLGVIALTSALALSFAAVGAQHARAENSSGEFNEHGNVLITDQFNNRVIEIDQRTKHIVWSFGSGDPNDCSPTAGHIIGLNDAERLSDGLTLLAGTGIPAPAPGNASGCPDNRVIVVNHDGEIVWQYGQGGVPGNGPNELNVPVFAIQLPNRNILITDQGNNRIIEVGRFSMQIVWSYGPASGPGALNNPNSAELLDNGHILIADENNNRVIEITRAGKIVWEYDSGLSAAAFASRLPNGHTLITDSGHARILEVTQSKHAVFQYFTGTVAGSNANPLPTNAVQTASNHIIIADQFNDRAIIIDRNKTTDFQYGQTNVTGNGFDQLNGPYTAFLVGDYTGQTPPPNEF